MLISDLQLTLPTFTDARGALCVADAVAEPSLPFTPQRVFWITDVPGRTRRGGHAHRSCHELLACIAGRCQVTLRTPTDERTFTLDAPHQALHIPPMVWCDIHGFSDVCALVCLASETYKPEGYIHDFQQFMREAQTPTP
ncbi:MAG: FdtA/QdtA family cupin domain-containing protein [Bacteroidaceae bacterium]|nr:FdtA/QdtA family cupin domain-containing protein [Bacteroidaceae bacterium]